MLCTRDVSCTIASKRPTIVSKRSDPEPTLTFICRRRLGNRRCHQQALVTQLRHGHLAAAAKLRDKVCSTLATLSRSKALFPNVVPRTEIHMSKVAGPHASMVPRICDWKDVALGDRNLPYAPELNRRTG